MMNVSEGTVSGAAKTWDFYIFKNWLRTTVGLNPPSIAANTQVETLQTVTHSQLNIPFSAATILYPPDDLNTGLMYCGHSVPRNLAVNMFLGNATTGAINDTDKTWDIFWMSGSTRLP